MGETGGGEAGGSFGQTHDCSIRKERRNWHIISPSPNLNSPHFTSLHLTFTSFFQAVVLLPSLHTTALAHAHTHVHGRSLSLSSECCRILATGACSVCGHTATVKALGIRTLSSTLVRILGLDSGVGWTGTGRLSVPALLDCACRHYLSRTGSPFHPHAASRAQTREHGWVGMGWDHGSAVSPSRLEREGQPHSVQRARHYSATEKSLYEGVCTLEVAGTYSTYFTCKRDCSNSK